MTVAAQQTGAGTSVFGNPSGQKQSTAFTGGSNDISYGGGTPELPASAIAQNQDIAAQYGQVSQWDQSGLNAQLQQMIATGNYAGAFKAAAESGQIEAMLDPLNLSGLVPGGQMTEAQFQQYYAAFAPYQQQLKGSSQDPEGVSDSIWSGYNSGEAAKSWASAQDPTMGDPFKDIPNAAMFGSSTQQTNLGATAEIVGLAATLAVPALAPELAAAEGTGAAVAGAEIGAAGGALTGYGETGTASGALKGGLLGAVGGGLAEGGAADITAATGIPQGVVSTGIRTGIGAVAGGTTGAEMGLISGGLSAGLQEAGASQSVSGPAGAFLGSAASSALSSPSGGNVVAQANPTFGIDPASASVIGASSTMPALAQVGTGGSTSPPGVASPATSSATDTSTGLDAEMATLFGAPTAGSATSGLGTYGALAGLGIYAADQAQSSNAATVAPAYAMGQPFVNAGQSLLNQGMAGQLTPLQQQALTTGEQQGQTLINAATPVGQIAQQWMTQFQSGNLLPADQAALNQSVEAATAQAQQALGPNVDSTTMATYTAQIQEQALITKQQILNGYLATGNQEFDQWAQTTEAGQATITAAQNQAVQNIDQTFSEAFAASATGQSPIMQAIQDTIQSNTQIANALQSYMGNLTKAFALQKAASTVSGGSGAGGAAGAAGAAGAGTATVGEVPTDEYTPTPAPGSQAAGQVSLDEYTGGATSYGINDPSAPAASPLQSIYSGPSFSSQASSGIPSYTSGFSGYYG
jgi:hypothetical protein